MKRPTDGDDMDHEMSCEKPTTPCPRDEGAHQALLDELENALTLARRSMRQIKIDDE